MRWILLALSAAIAGGLWLPGQAAEPAAAVPPTAQNGVASSAADDTITFCAVPRLAKRLHCPPP
jgi:hypothetical protein